MNHPFVGFFQRSLNRWVLLRSAETAAQALPAHRRARVVALHRAGDVRYAAAFGERGVVALIVARAAATCYLEAAISAWSEEPLPSNASPDDLWELYDALAARGLTPPLPPALESIRQQASAGQTPDEEIAEHGEGRIDQALELTKFLASSIEIRTLGWIRFRRWLMLAALFVFALYLASQAVGYLRPNRALHAHVAASSQRPGSGPPETLTNGTVEPTLAFATKDEPDPWITLDLGPARSVSEITLVNSNDHLDDSLPLRAETSTDGTTWEPAGTWTAHFSPTTPATLTFPTRIAHLVRIHGRSGGAIYLNEVEVR